MIRLEDEVRVQDLDLDPVNPRLPEVIQNRPQGDLLSYLFENDVLDELAESFVANDFFPNEPIIVLPATADGRRVVVEGNRRVSALQVLLELPVAQDVGLRFSLSDALTAEKAARLRSVPAVEVADHDELASYLGFRHISGLRTWGADAKARYVHGQVEKAVSAGSNNPFYEVGRKIGSNAGAVRNQYIAFETLRYARDEFGLREPAQQLLDDRFGVWLRLLGTKFVPDYIGLGDPERSYEGVQHRIESLRSDELGRVLADLLPRTEGRPPVLNDSRDVTLYSEVLGNDRARATLDRYGDLSVAGAIVKMGNIGKRIGHVRQQVEVLQSDVGLATSVNSDAVEEAQQLVYHSSLLNAGVASKPVQDP